MHKNFFVLLALWIAFSGYFNYFFLLCGVTSVVITMLITQQLTKNCEYHMRTNGKFFTNYLNLLCYLPWIILQVILSSWYTVKKVWKKDLELNPVFKLISSRQEFDLNLTLTANSITLTPGTISVIAFDHPYKIKVHSLDKELLPGITDIDNKVLKVFT